METLLAVPFLRVNAIGYATRAFELSRQFLFKWTVNWRFVGEEIFVSRVFSWTLLIVHLSILVVFASTIWLAPSRCRSLTEFVDNEFRARQPRVVDLTSSFTTTTLLTSLVIGLLCARTLHYQFFAYLCWVTPFLLWKGGYGPVLTYVLWGLQEWAWNVYPSTRVSSLVVVFSLGVQVIGPLMQARKDHVQ